MLYGCFRPSAVMLLSAKPRAPLVGHLLRQAGCHLVYDCWLDDPAQHVSVDAIFEHYGHTLSVARRVLDDRLQANIPQPEAESREALASACS